MFWRKKKPVAQSPEARSAEIIEDLRKIGVQYTELGLGIVTVPLPKGAEVDAFSTAVGTIELPGWRRKGCVIYSISSYDIDLHDLRRVRPAEAALGEGERLADPASGQPEDDYRAVHTVEVDDGPLAKYGGYLMRLQLFEDRYLRAFRVAAENSKGLETAVDLVNHASFAKTKTPLDTHQTHPDAMQAHIGHYFEFAPPAHWTIHPGEDAEDVDLEVDSEETAEEGSANEIQRGFPEEEAQLASDRIVCLSPDQRALAEVRITEGFAEEALSPADIQKILDENIAQELQMMEGQGGGVVLARTSTQRIVATVRQPDGGSDAFQRLYTAESLSANHRVYVHYWLTLLAGDGDEAEWESLLESFEPCIHAALIFHPKSFIVGKNS